MANVSSKSLIQNQAPHSDFALLRLATIVAGRLLTEVDVTIFDQGRVGDGGAGGMAPFGPAASAFCFAFPAGG